MAFDIVLGTVSEFIEIAQTITAIFIVYYLFRFLFFEEKGADEAWNKRGADARQAIGKLMEDHKKKKEHKEKLDDRKKYLNKSLGYLHLALEAAQELQERLHTQTKSEIDKTKSGLGKLKSNLSTARRNSRGAHRHHKDDMTDDLRELHAAIDAVYEKCKDLLEDNIPRDEEDRHFGAKAQLFRHGADKISKYIAGLYSSVRNFIEKHDQKKLQISASMKHLEEAVKHHKANMQKLKEDHAKSQAHKGAEGEAKQHSELEKQARERALHEAKAKKPTPSSGEKEFVPVAKLKRRR